MPKEITHDLSGWFDVVVGWQPGADMQLGLQVADTRALVTKMYGERDTLVAIGRAIAKADLTAPTVDSRESIEDFYAQQGRQVLDIVEGSAVGINSGDSRNRGYDSIWSSFDRDGCNRLIRTLRKARDSAFGKDE